MNRRIGIFGGSFDPVHNGHITLALHFLEQLALDEVWFMVTPQNPLKTQRKMLDRQQRFQLVEMALENHPQLVACDFEFRMQQPAYTWHTLQALGQRYPDDAFVLLIGSDNWAYFTRWFNHEEIVRHYDIAIYPRPEALVDTDRLPPRVTVIDCPLLDVSSSMVRQAVADGRPIAGYVPPVVARQIEQWRAYQPAEGD